MITEVTSIVSSAIISESPPHPQDANDGSAPHPSKEDAQAAEVLPWLNFRPVVHP
ncbi:hypothetical protein [Umezawaea sp. Da 62-37]|uniref:hypothetical protein n=1 Tax=Umezawaea sp. Da 62-37 TaxID=3075927 RepID=UPI0028F70499|nr:hypothetical protein [Umezawaea sp. Da 62-37]WNV85825.1 hypothetical protein RM788_48230 [Umezawaea sp. Da 62-37]